MKTIEDRARELAKELGPLGSVTYAAKVEADRDRLRDVNKELLAACKSAWSALPAGAERIRVTAAIKRAEEVNK